MGIKSQSRAEKYSVCKNVRMLNTNTESLEKILSKGKATGYNTRLRFSKIKGKPNKRFHSKGKQKIEFVRAHNPESYGFTGTSSSMFKREVNKCHRP